MKYKIWHWLIISLAIVSISITFILVRNHFLHGGICISFLSIPACYIVLSGTATALISHLFDFPKSDWIYFTAMGLVGIVAIYGNVGHLIDKFECPKCVGISMCLLSLTTCIKLIIFKYLDIKSNAINV